MAAVSAVSARAVVALAGAKSQKRSGFCTGARVSVRGKASTRARLAKSTLKVRARTDSFVGWSRSGRAIDQRNRTPARVSRARSRAPDEPVRDKHRSFPQGGRVRRKCADVPLPLSPRTQAGRSGLVVRASEVDDELAAVSAAVEVGPHADRAPRRARVPDASSSVIFKPPPRGSREKRTGFSEGVVAFRASLSCARRATAPIARLPDLSRPRQSRTHALPHRPSASRTSV
jgi:hypothetical protein